MPDIKKKNNIKKAVSYFINLTLVYFFSFSQNAWAKPENAGHPEKKAYRVEIATSSDPLLPEMIRSVSTLATLQHSQGVDSEILAARIRGDYAHIRTALESQGYYAGKVIITAYLPDGRGIDGQADSLADELSAARSEGMLRIVITPQLGPLFHIGHIDLRRGPLSGQENPRGRSETRGAKTFTSRVKRSFSSAQNIRLSAAERSAFGLKSGMPAKAAEILLARSRLQTALEEEGHAQALVGEPVAYLHPETETLDLECDVGVGPVVAIGPISFSGEASTKRRFLDRRLSVHEGMIYQPSHIEAARQDIAATGIFASVEARKLPPLVALATPPLWAKNGEKLTLGMPLQFRLQEAKRHTVSAQIGYSTDLGGRAGASWTRRNVLGNAEQLKLTALVTGLGGSAQQGLGYDYYADFSKPDFLTRKQTLNLRLENIKQLLYSYHQTAILIRGGVARPLTRSLHVSAGLVAEQEKIRQFGATSTYFILQVPLSATYDGTGVASPIDPATHGTRVNLNLTPSESLENGNTFFFIMSAGASTYLDLSHFGISKPGRSVIAFRASIASVQGASTFQIPPDQRLYAGGGATVRGFRYQGVGPQQGKYGVGGTSLDAATVEFRQRLFKSFGMAAFIDAGQVGSSSRPFQGTLRVGYGLGVRYFTPIGPVRLDFALPANRPSHGDKWELYIGLGETF